MKNCSGGAKQVNTARLLYDRMLTQTSIAALESVHTTHEHALSAKEAIFCSEVRVFLFVYQKFNKIL
jgi:hypothetical protein